MEACVERRSEVKEVNEVKEVEDLAAEMVREIQETARLGRQALQRPKLDERPGWHFAEGQFPCCGSEAAV